MFNYGFYGRNSGWLVLVMVWDLFWRAMALWSAARAKRKGWFAALLIVSSAGILPIIYLWFVDKKWFKKYLKIGK